MFLSSLDGPEAVADFIHEIREDSRFADWLTAVLDWSVKNEVECHPVENDGWCVKVVLTEAGKRIHDYATPINRIKKESAEDYAKRTADQMSKVCAEMRRASLTGRLRRDYAAAA